MRYMLLFCGSDEDRRAFEAMGEDELRARYGEVAAWFADLDAALAMARAWPGRGSVEIRPMVER